MKVTLITATFNDLVHGTTNNKKTGCGINLLKPETASRFRSSGEMHEFGELTCEKCKAKIAKELIKSDSKERKALLKEEKRRAKLGLDDEGLVQLSEYTVKPTSAPQPETEPEPETPAIDTSNVQVNTSNPAFSDDLAQFAIQKPQEEPAPAPAPEPAEESVDDFLAQFAVQKPQEEPAPEPVEESVDDFLAQFAVQKPQEEPAPEPVEESVDDFLAQFTVQKPQEEPAPEPVEESVDDFLAQFSVDKTSGTDVTEESTDDFLAQFSVSASETEYEEEAPASPPVLDDISSALEAMQSNPFNAVHTAPEQKESLDDILSMSSIEDVDIAGATTSGSSDVIDDYEEESIFDTMDSDNEKPEISDLSEWDTLADKLFGETASDSKPETPTLDDISVPEIEDITAPEIKNRPVPEIEDIAIPAIEDIAPAPVQPQNVAPAPVQPQNVAPAPVQPQNIAPAPVQPQNVAPAPVQPQNVAPAPVQPQNVAPAPVQPMTATIGVGQVITVPQITGYSESGQPIYAYAQMIMQGYDQNGQPVYMPLPAPNMMGMPMGMPAMQQPVQPMPMQSTDMSIYGQNSRLQEALAALDAPVSEKEMTIGQKIAAANASKPVTANVSKIATNPHSRSTSQTFISAISESKDATQSLTETQGLKPKSVVLDSVEDVLAQLGDSSLKDKKAAEAAAAAKKSTPVYEEFKLPQRSSSSSSSFSRPVPSSSGSSSSAGMDDMPLTKAQQKELKRQQKIDAKFQKEMAKRKK